MWHGEAWRSEGQAAGRECACEAACRESERGDGLVCRGEGELSRKCRLEDGQQQLDDPSVVVPRERVARLRLGARRLGARPRVRIRAHPQRRRAGRGGLDPEHEVDVVAVLLAAAVRSYVVKYANRGCTNQTALKRLCMPSVPWNGCWRIHRVRAPREHEGGGCKRIQLRIRLNTAEYVSSRAPVRITGCVF